MNACWNGRLRAALVASSLATMVFTCVPGEPITPAPNGEFAVVAFGDSLTSPSQVSAGPGWPASLPDYLIEPALRAICEALAPSEPSFQCDGWRRAAQRRAVVSIG